MFIHVVKRGEVLQQIANLYRISQAEIIRINGLPNPNQLLVGQALVIPTEDIFHTIRSGEMLWKIAQTYKTTVQDIMANNNVTNPANVVTGTVLYIPAPRHRVKPGESLWRIARTYGVSLQSLLKVNNIDDPNLVYPGTVLVIPQKQRPTAEVNGYIYMLGDQAGQIVADVGEFLTYVSPFAYRIQEDGSLQAINDTAAVNAAAAEAAVPMMSITNFSSTELGQNLAHVILANSQIQANLFNNIISTMRAKGYKGMNIDFENVLPEDKELYNQFLRDMTARMHKENFFISSALAPKLSGEQQGLLYTAHDYGAHGDILDFVVLMTYEWGWRFGPPQAISPISQIHKVIDYALSVMPKEKIFFGFQIYARDWLLPHKQGQEAETFSNQEAVQRAVKYNVQIQYDPTAESPFFRYTDEQGNRHEVWFEDARSAQAKFDMVKSYGLRGISYWALGYPYPQNWALLEDNFTVKKLQ